MTELFAAALKAHEDSLAAQRDMLEASARRGKALRELLDSGLSAKEVADAMGVKRERIYVMMKQGEKP